MYRASEIMCPVEAVSSDDNCQSFLGHFVTVFTHLDLEIKITHRH